MSDKAARIRELEADLSESREFVESMRSRIDRNNTILQAITAIHQPYFDWNLMPASSGGPAVSLRCSVCDTPEHHTWGPANDEPWPCPTLRTFMDLDAFTGGELSGRHAKGRAA